MWRWTRRILVGLVSLVGIAALWRELQQDQTTLSKQSCHVVAERSHHRIASEQPEVVVEAIRATVDAVRRSATPVC